MYNGGCSLWYTMSPRSTLLERSTDPCPSKTPVKPPSTPETGLSICPWTGKALYKTSFSTVSLGSKQLSNGTQKGRACEKDESNIRTKFFGFCLGVSINYIIANGNSTTYGNSCAYIYFHANSNFYAHRNTNSHTNTTNT